MNTDPIADMLSRIRNAALVNARIIEMPYSKLKESVAVVLKKNGYLHGVAKTIENSHKTLVIEVNEAGTNPKIKHIKRISKPGQRAYASFNDIPLVRSGRGMVILSTSKGILSGHEARKQKTGGELILEVY